MAGSESRARWPDARLDAFYAEFQRVLILVEKIAVLETDLRNVAEDTQACRKNLHTLRNELAKTSLAMRNDLAAAARTQVEERKSDRRWLIGTCLSTAALIIAAIGVLAGHIG